MYSSLTRKKQGAARPGRVRPSLAAAARAAAFESLQDPLLDVTASSNATTRHHDYSGGCGFHTDLSSAHHQIPAAAGQLNQHAAGFDLESDCLFDPSAANVASACPAAQGRSKTYGKKPWLMLRAGSCNTELLYEDRRGLLRRADLDIPIRDMRDLELGLHESESLARLLARENAIVICMDHVRAIIGTDKVVLPLAAAKHLRTTGDPNSEYVHGLVDHVSRWKPTLGAVGASTGSSDEHREAIDGATRDLMGFDSASSQLGSEDEASSFELHVLEWLLKEVWLRLQSEVEQLEAKTLQITDAFVKSPNTAELEKSRRLKLQHSGLAARVDASQSAMKRYLEDDSDLVRLCISARLKRTDASALQLRSPHHQQSLVHFDLESRTEHEQNTTEHEQNTAEHEQNRTKQKVTFLPHHEAGLGQVEAFEGTSPSSSIGHPAVVPAAQAAVEELEDAEGLLELYYANMSSLERKLALLGEYIDDAEDYVNIELDFNRNRLIRVEILLTIAMFALGFLNLTAGVLGENLVMPKFLTKDVMGFYGLNFAVTLLCIMLFAAIVWYCRRSKLL